MAKDAEALATMLQDTMPDAISAAKAATDLVAAAPSKDMATFAVVSKFVAMQADSVAQGHKATCRYDAEQIYNNIYSESYLNHIIIINMI